MRRNKTVNEKAFPAIDVRRSGFNMRPSFWDTFSAGDLFPICEPIEVYPGDTFSVDMSSLIRMSTPQTAVMSNATFDSYAFFVPMRLVWDHTKQFFGEVDHTSWQAPVTYQVPQYTLESSMCTVGSLPDHFGIAPCIGEDGEIVTGKFKKISALPFRAYQLIYNEWFRNQQIQEPLYIPKTDNGDDATSDLLALRKIGKFHDMFVDALPEPQFGDAVQIPIGALPVVTGATHQNSYDNENPGMEMRWGGSAYLFGDAGLATPLYMGSGTFENNGLGYGVLGVRDQDKVDALSSDWNTVQPVNLWAVGNGALGGTIDDLRYAFAIQRMLTRENYGGTRYTEIIRSFFSVISPDGRLQRPEYLGGTSQDLSMSQVIQTSSTDETTPQGNVTGMSKTIDSGSLFTRSFTEHGMIILLGAVRTENIYQRGLNKYWTKKDKLDFYNPCFAMIGNQPILRQELSFEWDDNNSGDEGVFGYQEAFYDLRFMPSKVKGHFRSRLNSSLDVWHYAENLGSPVLTPTFVEQGSGEVDRTLAVSEQAAGFQFFGDFYLNIWATRVLPQYSYPGLVDHF